MSADENILIMRHKTEEGMARMGAGFVSASCGRLQNDYCCVAMALGMLILGKLGYLLISFGRLIAISINKDIKIEFKIKIC